MDRYRMKVVVEEVEYNGVWLKIKNNRGVEYEVNPDNIEWRYKDEDGKMKLHTIKKGTVLECDRRRTVFGQLRNVRFTEEG